MVGDTQRLSAGFTNLYIFGGGWCCWFRVIFEWQALLGQFLSGSKIWNSLFLALWTLTLKVWMLKFLGLLPPKNFHMAMGNHILQNGWVFPLSSGDFPGFLIWFVEVVWLQSHPVLKERFFQLTKLPWRKFRMISHEQKDAGTIWMNSKYFDINSARHTWW